MIRGDLEAIRELLAPDVKWHRGDPEAPWACHDRDEALAFMQGARERRSGPPVELLDVIDAGDRVVAIMQPPPEEDGQAPPPQANVTTFRDGKVVEMVGYDSPEAALAAAGIDDRPTYTSR